MVRMITKRSHPDDTHVHIHYFTTFVCALTSGRCKIFPYELFGNASTICTSLGFLKLAKYSVQSVIKSSATTSSTPLGTTYATTDSPHLSSGTPITAVSLTP